MTVDEVDAAGTGAMDRRDVQLHRRDMHRRIPRAGVEHMTVRGGGIVHAQRDRGDLRLLRRSDRAGMRVDDDVHAALAIQQHLARAVPCDRLEADQFEYLAECLRLRGRVLDVLDAFDAERIARVGDRFAVGGLRGGGHGVAVHSKLDADAASPLPL